ncbi:MAG: MFS transporter [Pseudomonadota bacterium]
MSKLQITNGNIPHLPERAGANRYDPANVALRSRQQLAEHEELLGACVGIAPAIVRQELRPLHFDSRASQLAHMAWRRVALLLFAVGWGANHFVSLLQVYRARLALDAAAPGMLFAMYALGLAPGLLLAGPVSDRYGRRAVVLPSALVALAASALLGAAGASFSLLLGGRLLYGLGAGGVMSAGGAWLIELSSDSAGAGPRRATIALSSGFGLGPLVTGVLAQCAPAPTRAPFVLHVAVLGCALLIARRAPDTGARAAARAGAAKRPLIRIELEPDAWSSFLRSVAPMAPFVFGFPAIAFAALPSMLGGALGPAPLIYTGALCAFTLAAGVLAQPITRRFAPTVAARLGLVTGTAGVLLGALAVTARMPAALLVVAPLLGAAYGVCMTSGIQSVQRLAPPEARGGVMGLFYLLTYIGFLAPYLLALATRAVTPAVALEVVAAASLITALIIR